jgi:hypothetical protein
MGPVSHRADYGDYSLKVKFLTILNYNKVILAVVRKEYIYIVKWSPTKRGLAKNVF